MSEPALLEVAEIRKHFGGTTALRGVSCRLRAGEVLALLGHNGAGKSTLVKILAGVYRADGGEVRIAGVPLAGGVAAARAAGLAVIYQDLSLFPNLSVAENIAGDLGGRFGFSPAAARRHAANALRRLGMDEAARHWLDLRLADLPLAVQQQVAITRALARDARILILDEPTASLSVEETERLLYLVRQLAAQGCGIIFVSHRMAEVRSIADRFLVLRDGAVSLDGRAGECSDAELAQALFGNHAGHAGGRSAGEKTAAGPVVLDVRHCSRAGEFDDVSLQLRAGEVTVLTGLVGSGRSEFAQSLFGLRRLDQGDVTIAGKPLQASHPRSAIRAGLAYVPEDRLKEGLFPRFSVDTNLASAVLDRLSRWGLLPQTAASATRWIQEYGIRCAGPGASLSSLSGGNQQKVLLAKWQNADPQVLILDEPTAGVDVGAKAEIHERVRSWTGGGKAVLAISSDVDEVLDMADRVLVFHHGRLVLDQPCDGLTRERLIVAMLTGAEERPGARGGEKPGMTMRVGSRLQAIVHSQEGRLAFAMAIFLLALALTAPGFFRRRQSCLRAARHGRAHHRVDGHADGHLDRRHRCLGGFDGGGDQRGDGAVGQYRSAGRAGGPGRAVAGRGPGAVQCRAHRRSAHSPRSWPLWERWDCIAVCCCSGRRASG